MKEQSLQRPAAPGRSTEAAGHPLTAFPSLSDPLCRRFSPHAAGLIGRSAFALSPANFSQILVSFRFDSIRFNSILFQLRDGKKHDEPERIFSGFQAHSVYFGWMNEPED
jgi:hypothetical protein